MRSQGRVSALKGYPSPDSEKHGVSVLSIVSLQFVYSSVAYYLGLISFLFKYCHLIDSEALAQQDPIQVAQNQRPLYQGLPFWLFKESF